MADNPSDSSDAPRDLGQGGFTRGDVDAVLNEAAASAPNGESGTADEGPAEVGPFADAAPSDMETILQADIDALLSGAGNSAGPSQGGAPPDTVVEAGQAASRKSAPTPPDARLYEPQGFGDAVDASIDPKRVTMLNDVNLRVRIQLGHTRMLVEDVLKLGEGSVVELDKLAGDPVDVLVNDRLIARGEVLVLNDNFCVRICEVLSHDPHRITQ